MAKVGGVLEVVQREVTADPERGRGDAAGPGAIDAVEDFRLPRRVVLPKPADEQVTRADGDGQGDRGAGHLRQPVPPVGVRRP